MTKFEQAELIRLAAAKLPHDEPDLKWQLLAWSRELLNEPETINTGPSSNIMNKFQVAKDYVLATQQNQLLESALTKAVQLLDQDNQLNLYGPIHQAYETLVLQILGEQLFDYILVWIYELDFGKDETQTFEEFFNNHQDLH